MPNGKLVLTVMSHDITALIDCANNLHTRQSSPDLLLSSRIQSMQSWCSTMANLYLTQKLSPTSSIAHYILSNWKNMSPLMAKGCSTSFSKTWGRSHLVSQPMVLHRFADESIIAGLSYSSTITYHQMFDFTLNTFSVLPSSWAPKSQKISIPFFGLLYRSYFNFSLELAVLILWPTNYFHSVHTSFELLVTFPLSPCSCEWRDITERHLAECVIFRASAFQTVVQLPTTYHLIDLATHLSAISPP